MHEAHSTCIHTNLVWAISKMNAPVWGVAVRVAVASGVVGSEAEAGMAAAAHTSE